jgi:hypothetical protein
MHSTSERKDVIQTGLDAHAPRYGAPVLSSTSQRSIGRSGLVNRLDLCGRYSNSLMKSSFCREFRLDVWATGLGHEALRRV